MSSSQPSAGMAESTLSSQTTSSEANETLPAQSNPQESPSNALSGEPQQQSASNTTDTAPMSKNALKRLRRQQEWEDSKDERRKRRREKRVEQRGRQKASREALLAQGADPSQVYPHKRPSTLVPVAVVIDCDFEQYMTDKEFVSLSSQLTRSYSDNRAARFRSHLWVSGWTGRLRERFRAVLRDQHLNWKGIGFEAAGFLQAAEKARSAMHDAGRRGELIEPLSRSESEPAAWKRDEVDPFPLPGPERPLDAAYGDVVYLTSDSPYTLERLEPCTTYIVGGLVDKNREKGLCYRRACELGVRTARLPIGQFMVMQSRQVLATNHVVDIMLKWLEFEDWGKAFLSVIPKRKGGRLIGEEGVDDGDAAAHDDDEEEISAQVGDEGGHEHADVDENDNTATTSGADAGKAEEAEASHTADTN